MTTRIKIVSWFIAVGLLAGVYVAVSHSLRARLENSLSRLLDRQVTIESAQLTFPAGVVLKKVVIPADRSQESVPPVQIQEVVVHLTPLNFSKGWQAVTVELTAPTVCIRQKAKTGWELPVTLPTHATASADRLPLAITRLQVREGEVTVVDRQVSPEVTWTFRNISAGVSPSHHPGEYLYTVFGTITDAHKKPVGQCEISGHFFLVGTTEATISFKEMDLPFLAPYVNLVLGTAPSQGTCTLVSRVSAYQGALVADSTLSASGVAFPTEKPTLLGPTGNRLVELLRDSTGTIHLSFLLTGRPGEPLNWSTLTAGTIQESVRQGLAKGIQNVLSSTEQQPVEESVRRGMESLGR